MMTANQYRKNEIVKKAQWAWQIEKNNKKAIELYQQALGLADNRTPEYAIKNIEAKITELSK